MASQTPRTRISHFSRNATTSLILLLLVVSCTFSSRRNPADGDTGLLSFFADAFSPASFPHPYQHRPRIPVPIQQQQQQQQQQRGNEQRSIRVGGRIRRPLGASIPFFVDVDNRGLGNPDNDEDRAPAFLIECISQTEPSGDAIYKTISNLCIDVFFKELLDPSGKGRVNFVKEWQINYLKNLQAADLERRRDRYETTNEMFLAYEVKRTTDVTDVLSRPLLMEEELKGAYNMEGLSSSSSPDAKGNQKRIIIDNDNGGGGGDCFVRGDLLGFVEITQRPYGLGKATESSPSDMASVLEGFSFNERPMRPVLTNLAVNKAARQYGIGSKLLEACEEHVRNGWDMNEIVLEVEDYNTKGLEFYRQRGYEVLFSDPASRRYDIQGFWLNKVRCRREIMRKVFSKFDKRPTNLMESADSLIRRIVGSF